MNSSTTPTPRGSDTPSADADVVARLQQSALFRDYREAFQTTTGLPLMLRAAGTAATFPRNGRNVGVFCAMMAARNRTCTACVEMHARIETEAACETCTLECFAGLHDSVVPIRLGEKTIAYLQTGQVLFEPPTERQFHAARKQLLLLDPSLAAAEAQAAFFASRVLTRATYDAMLRLLTSFAQHLSLLANELMITQATTEPPAVARARAFIAERLGEELSLEQVARVASTSPFYFCKIFKAATGLTFTDYVARARVEKTKHLLCDATTRISEAAFAAGFQSLSQFNRVFRRIEGQSPSAYRERLHGAAAARAPAAA